MMVKTGEWLSEAWQMVQQDLVTHILIMLVVAVVSMVPFVGPAMTAGYMLIILRKLKTPSYKPAVGDVFEGFQYFVPALLVGIVGGIISSLGVIACFVGVFATTALVMFAMPIVVDRKEDFWSAIQMSMEKVKTELVAWSVFVLVLSLVYAAGSIAAGVGVLVTGPIALVTLMIAYREVFGLAGAEAPAGTDDPTAPMPDMPEPPSAPKPQ